MTATVHAADLVLTMSGDETTGDVIRDGAVLVEGALVTDVGTREEVVRRAGARARVRLWRGVLLPGLVNAHTHLELGPAFADLATAGLAVNDWRQQVASRAGVMGPDERRVELRGSVHAALRTGTTCVADVAVPGQALATSPPGGLAGWSSRSGVGSACGLESTPLAVSGAGGEVVMRTRSAAVLGLDDPPVAQVIAGGRPWAIGTESRASVPDLDLLAEARACRDLAARQGHPDSPEKALALLRAVTVGGAAALGVEAGTIVAGGRADLAVIDVVSVIDHGDLGDLGDHLVRTLDLGTVAGVLVGHGAGRCVATVLSGRLVHRRA